jgi:L-ascorbate metabolism protein UlaG (beta-lactamase superfamily)
MQTITVAGGNLYALAAKYLLDATQWIRIAQQNGLTDPMLSTVPTTLVIPDIDATATGGVPAQ